MLIESSDVFGAVLVVAILLVVLSVPSVLLTVRSSSKQLRRYRILRLAGQDQIDAAGVPKAILFEWASVSSPVSYVSMIADEMERISSLRPAILQSQIALVLMIALAIVPGYEMYVLLFIVVLAMVIVVSIVYWYANLGNYSDEYVKAIQELETNGNDTEDMIYR